MLLTAYLIDGQPVGAVLKTWLLSDLGGNPSFKVESSVSTGYADISSITNWDSFGKMTEKDFKVIKNEIKLICVAIGYNNLSLYEKILANKYFASGVEYNNSQVGASEQDQFFYNFFKPNSDQARQQRDVAVSGYMMKLIYTGQLDYAVLCNLVEAARSFRVNYLRDGITGIGYGDAIEGILNFIENDNGFSPYDIVGVDTSAKTFSVAGDQTAKFVQGKKLRVRLSTGNNGLYTIVSSSYDNTNTIIVVSEAIPDGTADGKIYLNGFFFYTGTTTTMRDSIFNIYWNGDYTQ